MRVHLLPLEPFEERYTAQWYRWWPVDLRHQGAEVIVYDGDLAPDYAPQPGGWLHPTGTWTWKVSQLKRFIAAWERGEVQDGDWVLNLDGWGPASEAIPYLRAMSGVQARYAAFWHSGAHDRSDLTAQRGMRSWALDVERGWMRATDLVLVGSLSERETIRRELLLPANPSERPEIAVVGCPVHRHDLLGNGSAVERTEWAQRPPLVVFPHRLAKEKQPNLFRQLAHEYAALVGAPVGEPRPFFRIAREECETKLDYYRLLAQARVVVSFAEQETFGIAMVEGVAMGAWAVAPHYKCYPEVLNEAGIFFRPWDVEGAAYAVAQALQRDASPEWPERYEEAVARAFSAMALHTPREG